MSAAGDLIRQRDEAWKQRDEARAESAALRARVEALERELDEIALGTGYAEQPHGRSGVERAKAAVIVEAWEELHREHSAALARSEAAEESMTATQEQLREVMLERNARVDALTARLEAAERERDEMRRQMAAGYLDRLAAAEALLGRVHANGAGPLHAEIGAFLAREEVT